MDSQVLKAEERLTLLTFLTELKPGVSCEAFS
jgi:hypothetical protein